MARPRLSRTAILLVCIAASVLLAPFGHPAATAGGKNSPVRGKIFYTERCIFCHGRDGSGWNLQKKAALPPTPVPDLSDPEFMSRFTDRELFKVIKEGGTRMGKSRFMPPAGNWLGDSEIRDVIAYIRVFERRPESEKKPN